MELAVRFLVGGVVVSLFAVIGDMVRPKSLAGVFGAAPSVALAALGLAFLEHGGQYASLEGRSMLVGAAAFIVYNVAVAWLLLRTPVNAWLAGTVSWAVWFAAAFGLWGLFLR